MARRIYLGSSNSARRISNMYIGVSGRSRQIIKGYIGINGAARQFYPAYAWKKYEIETTSKYESYVSQDTVRCYDRTVTGSTQVVEAVYPNCYTSYKFDENTGRYTYSGSRKPNYAMGQFVNVTGGCYYSGYRITSTLTSRGAYETDCVMMGRRMLSRQVTTQTQGSYIETVFSDSSTAYPDNGVSGNYWYVKIS